MQSVNVEGVIELIEELALDNTVPKNVKNKLNAVLSILKTEEDLKVRVNKVLNDLDDVVDDPNLQSYTRTQLWNIVSVLEKVE
ncbi:MAG: hypothetical protein GXP63_07270 [DPANN group archaeon]|nr:hypothetical protein [DPANN group archaeon]